MVDAVKQHVPATTFVKGLRDVRSNATASDGKHSLFSMSRFISHLCPRFSIFGWRKAACFQSPTRPPWPRPAPRLCWSSAPISARRTRCAATIHSQNRANTHIQTHAQSQHRGSGSGHNRHLLLFSLHGFSTTRQVSPLSEWVAHVCLAYSHVSPLLS